MAANPDNRTKSRDGRVRRGARNHEAIVQAIYQLVRETHLPPTVDDVARRAGLGRRTVFRQFADLDALYRTLGERVLREAMSLIGPAAPSGGLETDLVALVERRARVFEHITPFRRGARLVRHGSTFLQEQDRLAAEGFRATLLGVLEPHLRGTAAETVADTVEALDLLLSFEAWERLRHQQKTGVKRAQQILAAAALALLNSATAPVAGAKGAARRRGAAALRMTL
jgi:AcrR family transcriptional regulator